MDCCLVFVFFDAIGAFLTTFFGAVGAFLVVVAASAGVGSMLCGIVLACKYCGTRCSLPYIKQA